MKKKRNLQTIQRSIACETESEHFIKREKIKKNVRFFGVAALKNIVFLKKGEK